ncbi:hypothetical protein TrST_g8824 [Triparma strigata]|uniref:Uncharacterized protein n=1 Tax=Triparma strigata TaxID=1606541 RepID=A0A9W7F203_9STRA|nr:hypothetical protein TrST_g8824 [Triparma strigata]
MSSPSVQAPETGRVSPAIVKATKSDPSFHRSKATGIGRRTMREMMPTSSSHSGGPRRASSFGSLSAGAQASKEHDDKAKKINFVKMLLAIKMVKTDGDCGELLPNVFIGSIGSAYNPAALSSNGITHILCLCDGVRDKFSNDLTYLVVPCEDVPNFDIALKFIQCSDFIDNCISEGGKVLVHCFAGKSRCCAILMGYMMLRKGMSFEQALETCRAARPVVEPNLGFVTQLRALDRSLRRSRFSMFEKGKGKGKGKAQGEGEGETMLQPPRANADSIMPPEPPDQSQYPQQSYATPMAAPPPNAPPTNATNQSPMPLDTDLHHVNKAAQSTPKVSPGHKGSPTKNFSRSATLTLDYSDGSIVVKGKKVLEEDDEVRKYNKKVASRACDRLYTKAVDQRIRATEIAGQLSPECTFNPELNETSLQHALVARSRGSRGYMEETAAVRSLMKEQQIKAEASEARAAKKGSLERFSGYGSIFYDSEIGSPRDLGRTSPTVEDFDFIPNVKESQRYKAPSGNVLMEKDLETRLTKATVSSTIDKTIAVKKKEMIEKYGGKGKRDRLSASGLLVGVDEVEALVISEARRERMKKDEVQETVVRTTASARVNRSPPRQRVSAIMETMGHSEELQEGHTPTKDTLSSFLKRSNQSRVKEEIEEGRKNKKDGYLNDRFRSPGSILFDVEHSANIDVAHWQYADEEGTKKFMKKITDEDEVEKNKRRLQRLYKEGLKSYNERVKKMENAPLSPECTFSPTFYSKSGLKPKEHATGRSRDMSYDISTGRVKSISPPKVRRPARGGQEEGEGVGPNVITMATIRSARKKTPVKEREAEAEDELPEPSPLLQALSLGGGGDGGEQDMKKEEMAKGNAREGHQRSDTIESGGTFDTAASLEPIEGVDDADADPIAQHTRSHDKGKGKANGNGSGNRNGDGNRDGDGDEDGGASKKKAESFEMF